MSVSKEADFTGSVKLFPGATSADSVTSALPYHRDKDLHFSTSEK